MSSTVFVRNLPYGTTQQQLEELFGDIGPVKKVSVIKDKGRAKTDMTTRGFAFVKFAMDADAHLAIEKLNNSEYQGRNLCIDIAKEKKGPKPLAHQKPKQEEQVNESNDMEEPMKESIPVESTQEEVNKATEIPKKNKKEKKATKEAEKEVEPVEIPQEKSDKKAKKEKKSKEATEDVAEAVNEEQEAKPDKKAKKSKKSKNDTVEADVSVDATEEKQAPSDKKSKKAKKSIAEVIPEEKNEKKSKKRKLDASTADTAEPSIETIEPVSKKDRVESKATKASLEAKEGDEDHSQSERNARRREHRELLRQMKARKESSATTEEKSIAIYGLGSSITEKALKIKMKKIGDATKIEWKEDLVNGKNEHVAYVEWADLSTKEKALEKLNNHIFKGFTMTVRGLETTTTSLSQKDGVRLIVRNLQFDVKDADLEKLFSKSGPLAEVRVVRMPVENPTETNVLGRSRGFGFVQFKNKLDAQQAIETLNNTKLKGREIVVDYAVSKSEYVKAQAAATTPANDEEDSTEAAEEDAVDGEEVVEGEDAPELADDENTLEMEEDENDHDDDDDDEEEVEKSKPKVDTDSQRERTVFIRNLSFQTSEDGLAKAFADEFGPVEYARIVMDHGSGLSKGVAFVRFRNKDAADAAIARGSVQTDDKPDKKKKSTASGGLFYNNAMLDGDGIYVDGRLLSVTRSVAKGDADRLTEENSAKRKSIDKRNMYLAYEGTISVNKIAENELELPKMDVEKRRRAIKEKKEKLKNPLFFISPVRLSVRNLALSVDEKTLKTVFREAAAAGLKEKLINLKDVKLEYQLKKDVPVKIILAKIIRDTENVKAGEDPRSRGYGFVEFAQHVHALAALRKLNNNPAFTEYAGRGAKAARGVADKDKSRLIIEFALENHGKLKLREKRMNDAKKRRDEEATLRRAQGEVEEPKPERKSRGKRQREAKAMRSNEPVVEEKSEERVTKRPKTKPVTAPKPKPVKVIKPLGTKSRKQRKTEHSRNEEKSFDTMVNNYKQKLFSTVEDSEAGGRWFE